MTPANACNFSEHCIYNSGSSDDFRLNARGDNECCSGPTRIGAALTTISMHRVSDLYFIHTRSHAHTKIDNRTHTKNTHTHTQLNVRLDLFVVVVVADAFTVSVEPIHSACYRFALKPNRGACLFCYGRVHI